jgi:hypothetical protein
MEAGGGRKQARECSLAGVRTARKDELSAAEIPGHRRGKMSQRRTRNGHESPYERWEVKGGQEPVVKTKKRFAKQDENQRVRVDRRSLVEMQSTHNYYPR